MISEVEAIGVVSTEKDNHHVSAKEEARMILDALAALIVRKITAAYFATLMLSVALAVGWFESSDTLIYSNGLTYVLGSSLFFGAVTGMGVLFYGTPVSLLIDAGCRPLRTRSWLRENRTIRDLSYVAIHALFGFVSAPLFDRVPLFMWCAVMAAILYAIGDRWAYYQLAKNQGVLRIWLVPLGFALLMSIWIHLVMF